MAQGGYSDGHRAPGPDHEGVDVALTRAAGPGSTSSSSSEPRRAALWLFVALAVLPVLAAAWQVAAHGWVPEGDDAMIARRARSVLSTEPPITGQPTTSSSQFVGHGVEPVESSHPGPVQYWVLAVPYRLSGWSPVGLLAGAVLVGGASAAFVVWAAWRRCGVAGAAAGAAAVLVVAWRLGPFNLVRPLNATTQVVVLLAGLVGLWAVLLRDKMALLPAAVALTYAAQVHVATAPVSGLGLAVVLVAGLRWCWLDRDHRSLVVAGVTIGVLAVLWAPVLIEQVSGDPGNVTRLARVAGLDVDRAGPRFAVEVTLDQVVGLVGPHGPRFPTPEMLLPFSPAATVGRAVVGLAVLGGIVVWARRRRDRPVGVGLVVLAGAWTVALVTLTRGPATVPVGAEYQVAWLTSLAGFAWFVVAMTAMGELRHRAADARPAHWLTARSMVPAGAAVAVLVGVIALTAPPPFDTEANDRTAAVVRGVRDGLPRGTYVLSASGNWAYLSTLDAVALDLLAHGYDVRLVRLGELPDEPRHRDLDVVSPRVVLDSTDGDHTGELLVAQGPLRGLERWDRHLRDAVADDAVRLVHDLAPDDPRLADPRVGPVVAAALGPDSPETRRQVASGLLSLDAVPRAELLDDLTWEGLDPFWVQVFRTNLPPPYPSTGLAAWLLPPSEG